MDMFEGVGRRRDEQKGQLVSIGEHSLNGYERDCLFHNDQGAFTDLGYVSQADRDEDGRGLSVFDYDLDGRLDLSERNYKQPAQLLHDVGIAGNWLQIKLVGTESNRDAVGARIMLRAGDVTQTREVAAGSGYVSSSTLVQHFGLGKLDHVDSIMIRWPSGKLNEIRDLAANERLMLREDEEMPVAVDRWVYPSGPAPPALAAALK
jgi:enediyne biosynthesis protein E4